MFLYTPGFHISVLTLSNLGGSRCKKLVQAWFSLAFTSFPFSHFRYLVNPGGLTFPPPNPGGLTFPPPNPGGRALPPPKEGGPNEGGLAGIGGRGGRGGKGLYAGGGAYVGA